ncbi:unnamed protein product [Orchesella dallaii]|uniref:Uncharacterized protein n=1 Tax=Orchesella dallaii TaxID=48710 RepID=A0ABP1RVJ1_9HEXA
MLFKLFNHLLIFTSLAHSTPLIKTISDCPTHPMFHLFSNINNNSERYVFYFMQTKEDPDNKVVPNESINSRVIAIHNTTSLNKGEYRFSNTFNVVIFHVEPNYTSEMVKLSYINDYLVPSRSIFLLITLTKGKETSNPNLPDWPKELKIFAALKLILRVPLPNRCNQRNETSVTVICSGYCSSLPKPLAEFAKTFQKNDLNSFHRSLFWNGNGKELPALIHDVYYFIQDIPKKEQRICISSKIRLNYRCNDEIMTMLTFSEIHNITINLEKLTRISLHKYGVGQRDQGPESLTFSITASKSYSFSTLAQMVFNSFVSRSFVYCPRLQGTKWMRNYLQFEIWYEPLTPTIWWSVLSLLIFGTVISFLHHRHFQSVLFILITYWGALFGAQCNRRYFILVASFAFLMQIYSNELGSIIIVGQKSEGLKTVRELLTANYKILVDYTVLEQASGEIVYAKDFKRLGLSTEGAFQTTNSSDLDQMLLKMAEENARLAFTATTSMAAFYAAVSAQKIRQKNLITTAFTCHVLEETVRQEQTQSVLKTENQYWLYVTLQRIRGAGLQDKWNEWSRWHYMLRLRLLGQSQSFKPGPQFVDGPKFFVIQVGWGTLMLISMVVFLGEICIFYGVNVNCKFMQTSINKMRTRILKRYREPGGMMTVKVDVSPRIDPRGC